MSLGAYLDEGVKRLDFIDIKLLQGAAVFLALVIAKLVPEILTVNVWWFAGLSLACAIKPTLVLFGTGPDAPGS